MIGGGGTLVRASEGRFIGPGHAGIVNDGSQEWFSFHYYDGQNRGRPTLGIRKLTWDKEGWPVVAVPQSHARCTESALAVNRLRKRVDS